MIIQEGKALLASKTFWIAVIQAIAGTLVIFQSTYPGAGGLLILKSALDIIIRYNTAAPITSVV